MTAFTKDEQLVCYMSSLIEPEDFVVQGMGTPLVFSAFLLAKETHAPGVQFMYTVGNTISEHTDRLSITHLEHLTVNSSLKRVKMTEMHCDIVPSLKVKEFIRPAQVDRYGNCNNVVIGNYEKPAIRLPGTGGITDVAAFNPNFYLYVTRHSLQTLVEQLDFCSSVGYGERAHELHLMGRRERGPQKLITDRCVFSFADGVGSAVLEAIFHEETVDSIRKNTGFSFDLSAKGIDRVDPPSDHQLQILREMVDPLGIRELELLGGNDRLQKLEKIIRAEHNRPRGREGA
ncbi:CoA-transferase [Ferviditalea candida]|uniref:CoA-transferase n=1 Tax=Ferviditalea candida TaxID=3108399 RepID=A0ABU5ZIS3_9BACL|nr:CoA-transferase [Paenibacillaceae bacterium T2]